ncbi:MAG: tRNA (adenosine(37)-N6)-dimethylallyltransferase MiaA [Candidatus Uhrbacteria bacterium]|nr:tRNA (adenosine(37)-N6)-dimethylallyltransferase MiaA [Patescibacteria group bacterium]MBU1907069.1 tRNA (adenosine(37)-N6)-dimethylallyltransferase MiaA [Patescibacteria group bacterium]
MKPKIVVILGPTASGKTSMGVTLAKEFNGEIISVDSRQIYKGMDIGTAKEQTSVPQWGIDLVNPNQEMTAAEFKQYADDKIEDILLRDKLPILVGGTGFWAQAIIDNLDIPAVEPDFTFRKVLEQKSLDELFEMYQEKDPAGAEVIDRFNQVRLIRALEVCMKSGKPFSEQQKKGEPRYEVLQIGIEVDREVLYDRINNRVDQMIDEGLVEEVRALEEKYGSVPVAMSGIGYRQICKYLQTVGTHNHVSLQQAIEQIKKDTRNYAKRQMSWFSRDQRIKWVKDVVQAHQICKDWLRQS